MRTTLFASCLILVGWTNLSLADDWPQWLGPQRDGVWRESGIVERFPKAGLKVRWRMPVALGYAGPSVAGGKVFVADFVKESGDITNRAGSRDRLEGRERVLCFDADTGKQLWVHQEKRTYNLSYPGGPRCTPTVDGDRVYALGAEGNLVCLNVADGKPIWSKDLKKEYDTTTPIWGFAAHPLVAGDLLFCVVGGRGSVAVAFNKHTGKEVWRALSAPEPGYCPPSLIEQAGKRQLLIWHSRSLNSLDPLSGKLYWSVPLQPSFGMAIAIPRLRGNHLYASAYRTTAALLKLADDQPGAEVVWRAEPHEAVFCSTSTPFLEKGVIYGVDSASGSLMAVNMDNGKRLWETVKPTTNTRPSLYGTAFLVKHADRYFLFSDQGDLILAKLSPEKYEELDRFHVLEPTNRAFGRNVVWSHPAFAQRCLFARNDKELVCVSLAE